MPEKTIRDFTGGLWVVGDTPDSPEPQPGFTAPTAALLRADNVEFLGSGGIKGRRGSVKYSSGQMNGPVVAMFKHYPRPQAKVEGFAVCSGTNDASLGGTAWEGPEQTELVDDVVSTCLLSAPESISQGLVALNPYGQDGSIAVPEDATIVGVVVEIRRRSTPNGGMVDERVQLVVGGVRAGESRAVADINWNTYFESVYYGGGSDTWGCELTPAIVNGADFGVWLSCRTKLTLEQAQVDAIRLYVFTTNEMPATFLVATKRPDDRVAYRKRNPETGNLADLYVPPAAISYRPRFVSYAALDRTYVFDGANRVSYFDGQAFRDAGDEAQRGPYACFWQERLWATNPLELGYSVYASALGDPGRWDARFQLNVGDSSGGRITGLVGLGRNLLILKDQGVWSFQGDLESSGQLFELSSVGCIAPESIAVTPNGVIFVGRSGVYQLASADVPPVEISRPLRALFDSRGGALTYPLAVGLFVPRLQQYWLKLSPDDPGGYVLQRIPDPEGDRLAWSRRPFLPLNAGAIWRGGSDTGNVFLGSADGWVREFDVGNTDDGVPFSVGIRTSSLTLSPRDNIGRVTHVQARMRSTIPVTVALRYDEKAETQTTLTPTLGRDLESIDFQHVRASIPDQSLLGRTVALDLENSSDGPAFELHDVTAIFSLRSFRAWR